MFIQCLFKFFLAISLIDCGLAILNRSENETEIIDQSRKIIKKIEKCNQKEEKFGNLTDDYTPMINNENDVQCGTTTLLDVTEIIDNKINDQKVSAISMVLTFEAIKSKNTFSEIGGYIDKGLNSNKIADNIDGWYLTMVGQISASYYSSMEKRYPIYLDYVVSHLRVKVFKIPSKSNTNQFNEDEQSPKKSNINNEKTLINKLPDNLLAVTECTNSTLIQNAIELAKVSFNLSVNDNLIFYRSAAKGLLPFVKFYVEELKIDSNAKDSNGMVAAAYAALSNDSLDVLKYLMQDVDTIDRYFRDPMGNSLVHLAASVNNLDGLRFLVRNVRLDPNSRNNLAETPLFSASKAGYLSSVRLLCEEGKADINLRSANNSTALSFAATNGHLPTVRYLIRRKAIPMMVEENENNKQSIEFLKIEILKKEEKLKSLDLDSMLIKAIKNDDLISLDYLLEKNRIVNDYRFSDGRSLIHVASESNKTDLIRYLINERGFDVNAKDALDQTPLHYAAQQSLKMVKFLFEKGGNINATDKTGEMPIHKASWANRLDVIKFFASHNVDVTVKSFIGEIPYDIAKKKNYKEIVDYLKFARFEFKTNSKEFDVEKFYLDALEKDDLLALKYLIERKHINLDYRFKGDDRETFLQLAAGKKRMNFVKYLVEERGFLVNVTDNNNFTALHDAAYFGCIECVKYFVEKHNMDPNLPNINKDTVVHQSLKGNQYEVFKYLVNNANGSVNLVNINGFLSTMYAANHGCLNCMKLMIEEKNFDINAQDQDGYDALATAVQYRNLDIVKYLVNKGAILNRRYEDSKKSLLKYAEEIDNNKDVIDFLKNLPFNDINNTETKMMEAMETGNFTLLKNIIETKNISVNHKFTDQKTFLHYASEKKRMSFIRYLIDKGIDFQAKDIFGKNALHYGSSAGCLNCVKYLIEKGIDPNQNDDEDNTPVIYSTMGKHLNILKFLVNNAKSDPKLGNANGYTAVHYAASVPCFPCLKFLLEEVRIDINQKSTFNYVPLREASVNKRIGIVKYLISRGANLTAVDSNGESILEAAEKIKNNTEVINYLKEKMNKLKDKYELYDIESNTLKALENRNLTALKYIIESKNVNINHKFKSSKSFLHLAIEKTCPGCSKTVDKKRNNSDQKENQVRSLEIIKYLISKKANLKAIDDQGNTVLVSAEATGNKQIIDYLKEEFHKLDSKRIRKRKNLNK